MHLAGKFLEKLEYSVSLHVVNLQLNFGLARRCSGTEYFDEKNCFYYNLWQKKKTKNKLIKLSSSTTYDYWAITVAEKVLKGYQRKNSDCTSYPRYSPKVFVYRVNGCVCFKFNRKHCSKIFILQVSHMLEWNWITFRRGELFLLVFQIILHN